MEMKTFVFIFIVYVFSESSCDKSGNESKDNNKGTSLNSEEPRITLLSFASNDIYKGLDSKTFAIQISDEYHTKGFICPKDTGNFKDNRDCHYFYMCSDGHVKHLKCLPGFAFDSTQGYCSPRQNVISCHPPKTVRNNTRDHKSNNKPLNNDLLCTVDGAYADPKDCTQYYICVNGKPIQFRCPRDTKFDKNSKKCLPSDQAVCFDLLRQIIKPNWIHNNNGPYGPIPHSESELTSQESKYFSFVAYHPSM